MYMCVFCISINFILALIMYDIFVSSLSKRGFIGCLLNVNGGATCVAPILSPTSAPEVASPARFQFLLSNSFCHIRLR